MAKALGVGGIFFKCQDPHKLADWYDKWLGVPMEPNHTGCFRPETLPVGAITAWGPFKSTTEYFDPSTKDFMFNLIVDDLEGALAQVVEGGAAVVGEIEEGEYGRFGWFMDPEGNKVELWVPPSDPAPNP